MNSIILPFGSKGWKARTSLIEDLLSSRKDPPFIYNDILILVATTRAKRQYARLFLDAVEHLHKGTALVPPDVQTLHQFLQLQFGRLNGPRLIDENSRLILLEGLVKELLAGRSLFGQRPDLLAPSLSSVMAKTIEQLSAAGIGPHELARVLAGTEWTDREQVRLLLDVHAAYEQALREQGLTDPAGMHSLLNVQFGPSWLAPYSRIVIDGIMSTEKAVSSILGAIGACGNCTVLVDAPSPELLAGAGAMHPLRIVKDFLASSGIPCDTRRLDTDPDETYLASALFSERSFDEIARAAPGPLLFGSRLSLLSAVNTREEVSLIAREVKRSIRMGARPDSLLVTFPALEEYAPLVQEIFHDHGIPVNLALGRQLSSSPVAGAVIALLQACDDDFSGTSLLRVFSSPFLAIGSDTSVAPTLDRFLRKQRITGGRQRVLSGLKQPGVNSDMAAVLTSALQQLFAALEPFVSQEAVPLTRWMEQLGKLLEWAGLSARVSRIKGALNVNVQAYAGLTAALDSLAHAGRTWPQYRYTFSEWLFLLKKTFMHTRFQVPPEDENGVQVLGLEESGGHGWSEIYVGGLVEGKFPQRLPQNIFLGEQTLESLGVRTLERARLQAAYHFYRLLLSSQRVMMTWPENEGDRQAVPSPFLEELTPLKKAGLLNTGVVKTAGIHFSLAVEESCSIPELAKSLGLAGHLAPAAGAAWLSHLATLVPDRSEQLHALQQRIPEKGLPSVLFTPSPRREFSVTELDTYLVCPYDYYITRVCGIRPLEEVSEDVSPLDRGSLVHALLAGFYRTWTGPITGQNRAEAKNRLQALAEDAFGARADTFRNRREKDVFLNVMAERFLDAEIEFWAQGMRPAALEQKLPVFPLKLSNGEEIGLSGTIDRIDLDGEGNFMIVDYKTGAYPGSSRGTDQKIFQLPLYAVMAPALPDLPLRKPIGLVYYDLSGKTKGGARDVVLFDRELRNDHPSSKPQTSSKSTEEFESILRLSLDQARRAVEGIIAGNFPYIPRDPNRCRFCPNGVMCGNDEQEQPNNHEPEP